MSLSARKRSLDQRLVAEVRTAPAAFAASMVSNLLAGISIVIQALLLSRVIDRAFLQGASLADLLPIFLSLLFVIILRGCLNYISTVASAQVSIRVKDNLRQRFISHLYALGPAHSQTERTGDLVLTATDGVEKLEGYYRDYLPAVFMALLLPLLILTVVLPLDLLTFTVLLITAPLIPFFMVLIGMAAGALAKRQFQDMRYLGAHFLDVMQGLTTLKLFNRSQHQVETIRRITGEFREATMRVLRVAFLSALTLEMLATLSVAIVAVEIGVRLLNGSINFEQALFLLIIAPEFYMPLRALGAKFHNATEGKASAQRLFDVLDTPLSERNAGTNAIPFPKSLSIRFENVAVVYEAGTRAALKDVSFSIQAGQFVVLVGASGSGKTTIANLLLRFVQPDSGRIVVNSYDLSQFPIPRWREQIAWVSQSPYLFNTTVAENICFGNRSASDSQIQRAAQMAGAHDFIAQLPDAYQTVCGERGLRLSGGQVQRIALARAFLRDVPLLILDEPTSQLDPDSEVEIIHTLDQLRGRQTVLLITHRLSTAKNADHIIVLDEGSIVEQGTHTDLIASAGQYTRLVSNYDDEA